ncbi:UBX domain [Trinorchestia longiramus]|nr:UBX domain [Trinorchestia longiramus]
MTSKDEILANFQACSGIDDVGEAFTRLEKANWNLTEAYNSIHALPSVQDVGFPSSPHELVTSNSPADSGGPLMPSMMSAVSTDSAGAAARMPGTDAVLHINIQVLMGGMTGHGLFPLEVPRTTTVGELKSTLYQLLGILPCKQALVGFTGTVTDATVLTSDLLGPENTLSLDTVAPDTAVISSGIQTNHSSDPDVMEIGESFTGTPVAAHTISSDLLGLPGSSASGSSAFSKYEKPSLKPLINHSHPSGSSFNCDSSPVGSPSASFSSRKSNSHNHKRNKESSATTSSSHVISDSKSTSRKFVKSDSDSDDASDRRSKNRNSKDKSAITLIIKDTSNDKEYSLSFRRHQTVGNVKQDVSDITEIPVHRQQWTGWPNGVSDESTLARSGVTSTTHLSVKQASPAVVQAAAAAARKKTTAKAGQSDSSSDEFEDAAGLLADEDDDSFLEMMDSSAMDTKPKSLLPAEFTGSEQECVARFATEFGNRYGCSLAPLFFQGTLREAMDQSVMLPAAQRRMLAVYVHHDSSVLANVFCSQMLCRSATVSFVADNFVLWGWDVTHSQHRDRLVNIISSAIGNVAGATVRGFSIEQLPALMLLTRSRGSCEVISVIYAGNSSLDELVTSMMEAAEVFEGTRRAEVSEDQQRLSRQAIMDDQDAAYQESLRADRAKAEARRQQEEDEQREQQRQECIRQHEQQMTEKLRASLESELPPEPADHSSPDVTVMRFRHPGTDQFIRAFTLDTALQVVLNYLHVRGFPADQYKFLQSWPRRDLASLDVSMTLKDYALPHQETITIEER